MEYGLVYGLTNPYFDGLVKIGVTRNLDITKRMRVLGTAVPKPFVCAFAYKVPLDLLFSIERTLHDTFADKRLPGSEFFAINPAKADNLLRTLGKYEPMQSAVQEVIDIEEGKRTRRKNMDFEELGLRVGDTLTYARNNNIRCTICTRKTVDFESQRNVSLSSITKALLGYPVQPSLFWITDEGVLLSELQNRLYAGAVAESATTAAEHAQRVVDQAGELSTKCKQLTMQL